MSTRELEGGATSGTSPCPKRAGPCRGSAGYLESPPGLRPLVPVSAPRRVPLPPPPPASPLLLSPNNTAWPAMASPAPRLPVAGPSSEPKASMLKRMGGPSDLKAGVGRGGIRTAEEIQHIVHEVSKVRTPSVYWPSGTAAHPRSPPRSVQSTSVRRAPHGPHAPPWLSSGSS